jgi:NAD(P)-dependent dehydrogenase (short-subunit alcohol dehydrogenase family)
MELQELFGLKGKTAVVTGASGALGGAAVRGMVMAGANVAACYNSSKHRMDALLECLKNSLSTVKSYKVNSFNRDEIHQNAEDVMRDFGRIDVVINTAGGNTKGAYFDDNQGIFDLDISNMFDTVTLNLFGGCIWPCLMYGKKMLNNSDGGSMINFSSTSSYRAVRGHLAYAAAKAGVSNFTAGLASHLAHNYNPKLRVNAVAPGTFPNNNPAQMLFNPDGSYRAKLKRGIDHTPMGRMGDPNELMGTLIWLASNASSYVTGITVLVDGGFIQDSPQ